VTKFLLFGLLALPLQLVAQCCSGGVPMSNNIGLPTADKGSLQFNVNYDWNNLQTLKEASNELVDNTRQRETHSILFEFGYSFSDKFSLDLFVPWVRQERTITVTNTDFDKSQGLGDIVILPKYSINDQLTIGLGLKLPTGASDTQADGITLVADLQPGSGALDQILFISYSNYLNTRKSFGYFGNVIFRNTGKNNSYLGSATYEFGNELQVIAGIADRFVLSTIQIDPSLKIRYRKAGRDFFNDNEFPGSGGEFIFINPGISVILSKTMAWQINSSLPVYSFVNETQLSPTVQINTGISLKLNLKKTEFKL
jgi:hypothetical protein